MEREAAPVWIQSLHLLLDDLCMKKLSLFSTLSLTHKSCMSWKYFLKTWKVGEVEVFHDVCNLATAGDMVTKGDVSVIHTPSVHY